MLTLVVVIGTRHAYKLHINLVLLRLMITYTRALKAMSIKYMTLCVKAVYCEICFNSKVTQKGQSSVLKQR